MDIDDFIEKYLKQGIEGYTLLFLLKREPIYNELLAIFKSDDKSDAREKLEVALLDARIHWNGEEFDFLRNGQFKFLNVFEKDLPSEEEISKALNGFDMLSKELKRSRWPMDRIVEELLSCTPSLQKIFNCLNSNKFDFQFKAYVLAKLRRHNICLGEEGFHYCRRI